MPPGAPLSRDAGAELVIAAMNFLDRPYRRGGDSVDTGFDCSGFTRHLFGPDAGHRAAAPRRRAGARPRVEPGEARRAACRRSGVLQHAAPHLLARRHLRRRRALHPCPAQRRADPRGEHVERATGRAASPARGARSWPADRRCRRSPGLAPGRQARQGATHGTIAAMGETVIPLADLRYDGAGAAHPGATAARAGPAERPARPAAARPAHLGHRPLQLPLRLLHAQGGVRRHLPVPAAEVAAELRGDHAAGAAVRRAWRAQAPAHRRRAAAAQGPGGSDRDAGAAARRRWPAAGHHAHHQRLAAGAQGAGAESGRAVARDGEPRRARRSRLPRA